MIRHVWGAGPPAWGAGSGGRAVSSWLRGDDPHVWGVLLSVWAVRGSSRGYRTGSRAVSGSLRGDDLRVRSVRLSVWGVRGSRAWQRLREPKRRLGGNPLAVAGIFYLFLGKALAPAVSPVGAAQDHFGHRELGVERRARYSAKIQRRAVASD